MERERKIVFWLIGVCVALLLAILLIIVLRSNKDTEKKPDSAQKEEASEKYLLSEICTRDKSNNEVKETVSFEYDEFGRWSKATRRYKVWYTDDEWEQMVYEFSYPYVNGEPYTLVTLSGIYEGQTQTNTYDSSGHLRKSEMMEENPDKPGQKVVTKTVLYDENGRKTLLHAYWLSGRDRAREEIEYDVYGHYINWVLTEWDESGNAYVNDKYYRSECDEKGRVVRHLDSDGNLIYEFQYFDDGSRIEVEYDWEGNENKEQEYYYDSEGRVVKQIAYEDGKIKSTLEFENTPTEYDNNTYEYDEKGNLISKEDATTLMTFKYVPASLTEEQEKEGAKFYLDEEMCWESYYQGY